MKSGYQVLRHQIVTKTRSKRRRSRDKLLLCHPLSRPTLPTSCTLPNPERMHFASNLAVSGPGVVLSMHHLRVA